MPRRDERSLWVAASLFAASAWLYLKMSERRRRRGNNTEAVDSSTTSTPDAMVSSRGRRAMAPPIPYLDHFVACLLDPCDLQDNNNPRGYIPLCIAENKLVLDLVAERFMQVGMATAAFSDSSVYCYDSFLGTSVAREAAAYFLARRFLFPHEPDLSPATALEHIRPQHCAVSGGAAAVLHQLFYLLGEAGEACLIPAPYYAAFENDMGVMARIVPCPVHQEDPVVGPTDRELETAYREAHAKGHNPKFILLTHPNNPMGVIYKPAVMLRIVEWGRKRGMHIIVDELYALSTHKKYGHGFQSIIKILNNDLQNDVHQIWGVSKDFGCSGLRVATVYSHNKALLDGFATTSIFSGVSGPIQYLVAELLTDDSFVDLFLDCSRERLVASYKICTSKLDEMVLPYVPARAGLFVYVDFSSLLPERTFECEKKLSDLLFQYARVVLTPGFSQRDNRPGWFRICYSWVFPDVLEVAMERLSKIVAKIRRLDFDDLNDKSLAHIL